MMKCFTDLCTPLTWKFGLCAMIVYCSSYAQTKFNYRNVFCNINKYTLQFVFIFWIVKRVIDVAYPFSRTLSVHSGLSGIPACALKGNATCINKCSDQLLFKIIITTQQSLQYYRIYIGSYRINTWDRSYITSAA